MRKSIVYILFLLSVQCVAQTGTDVFNDTILHTLRIETTNTYWFDTLEADYDLNASNPDLYPQRYFPCDVNFDGNILYNCGFREKGNASNSFTSYGRKKPLKLSFDEFATQELDGLKKINLNNFTNDPSLMHDVIANKLCRDAGLHAPRTAFAKLFVNNEYIGLYLIIENVDKTFLKDAYGGGINNDGNLYKTDRGAHVFMNWLGSDKAAYKNEGLQLNTNETADDWTRFIHLVDVINNDFSQDFKQHFESIFDVHSYLKILAIEKLIRSWDSYWGGGNNFYLYEHPDGQIKWIPWDMNETFQDIYFLSGTNLLDGYLVPTKQYDKRPLLKRIFEVDEWKAEYLDDACELIHNEFTLNNIGKYILDRHNLIDSAYKFDTYKYNSYNDFEHSLTDRNQDVPALGTSGFVVRINYPGIYPFIQDQREWAVKQMKGWDKDCSIDDNSVYDLFVYPNPCSDYINIKNDITSFEYSTFLVYDFTGKLCQNTPYEYMEGDFYRLPLNNLRSGIYLLLKKSADGRIGRAKIIVQ